jgi:leucyl/phenylalanyl-tRNA--protein transferase
MFHEVRDASKVALVHLMARLRVGGYRLADTQFVTDHLTQFGAEELPRHIYKRRLAVALDAVADWNVWPCDGTVPGARALDALGVGAAD